MLQTKSIIDGAKIVRNIQVSKILTRRARDVLLCHIIVTLFVKIRKL